MSGAFNRCLALSVALNKAREDIAEIENHEDAFQKALAHLAPFFAQSVHSSTLVGFGHVAENHGTDEVVTVYPNPVTALNSNIWDGPSDSVFEGTRDIEWESELAERLDPDAEYDMELRLRRRP